MKAMGIDILVSTRPENHFYLTRYQTCGNPITALVMTAEGAPEDSSVTLGSSPDTTLSLPPLPVMTLVTRWLEKDNVQRCKDVAPRK